MKRRSRDSGTNNTVSKRNIVIKPWGSVEKQPTDIKWKKWTYFESPS